jgi:hypothetical protein
MQRVTSKVPRSHIQLIAKEGKEKCPIFRKLTSHTRQMAKEVSKQFNRLTSISLGSFFAISREIFPTESDLYSLTRNGWSQA